MAWIEVHQSLRDHRKVLALAGELDMPEAHVAGHMLYLWLWSLDNAPEGTLPASERIIERAAGWQGMAGALVAGMVGAGMLDRDPSDGRLRIHDWYEYAGKLIERRKSDAERKRRERGGEGHPASVQRTSNGHPTDGRRMSVATVPYPTLPTPHAEIEAKTESDTPSNNVATVGAADAAADAASVSLEEEPVELTEWALPGAGAPQEPPPPTPAPAQPAKPTPAKGARAAKVLPMDSEEVRLAALLRDTILSYKPDAIDAGKALKPAKLQNWAVPIDLMLRVDKRSVADIEAVIAWLPTSDFWPKNILSPSSLREKFDRLQMQMRDDQAKRAGVNSGPRPQANGGRPAVPDVDVSQIRRSTFSFGETPARYVAAAAVASGGGR